jgi:alkylated DNA repair dioxygenase AlkB
LPRAARYLELERPLAGGINQREYSSVARAPVIAAHPPARPMFRAQARSAPSARASWRAPPRAPPARFVPVAPVARRPRRPIALAVVGGGDRPDASSSASSTASSSSASSPRPPPPKGAGSAAAALQDATTPEELLAAATLLVLPGEETAHWQAQLVHRRRRRVASSRALARLARWLAPAACLVPDGQRDATARDPRFHRLVRAAAAPLVEPHERDEEADEEDAHAEEKVKVEEAEAAADTLRALGSLAPLPSHLDAACGAILARALAHRPVPPRVATPAAWAVRRLRLASSADQTASRVAKRSLDAAVGVPFAILPGLADGTRDGDSDLADLLEDDNEPTGVTNVGVRPGVGQKNRPAANASSTGASSGASSSSSGWLDASLLLESAASAAASAESEPSGDVSSSPPVSLTVDDLASEVPFRAEQLVTRDGRRVDERRETCWMAEPGVGGLAYSGKVMSPTPFTPTVAKLRDWIWRRTGQRFDCALLNLYPSGGVACAYHTDPDLGRLWARDSVIVSVGETRRFAFRKIGDDERDALWFRVRGGDCVWMFADCNDAYEHCVYSAEGEANDAPRASIVFKRAMAKGKKGGGGHKAAGASKRKKSRGRGNGAEVRGGRGGGGGGRGGSARGGGGRGRGRGRDAYR